MSRAMRFVILSCAALAALSLGCGARKSQWITVTDCTTRAPITGANIRLNRGAQGIASVSYGADSSTNDRGQTWGAFPQDESSWVTVTAMGYKEAKADVPAA